MTASARRASRWTRAHIGSVPLALCAVALIVHTATAQTWYALYEEGLAAIKVENWSVAEARLQAARKLRPKDERSVRKYGTQFIDYLPEYYLGVVYFNTGRYAEATAAFKRAASNGSIRERDREFAELGRLAKAADERRNAELAAARPQPSTTPSVAAARPGPTPPPPAVAPPTKNPPSRDAELQAQQNEARRQVGAHLASALDLARRNDFDGARAAMGRARALNIDADRVEQMAVQVQQIEFDGQRSTVLAHLERCSDVVQAFVEAQACLRQVRQEIDRLPVRPATEPAIRVLRTQAGQGDAELNLLRNGLRAYYAREYLQALTLLQNFAKGQRAGWRALYGRAYFYMASASASLALLEGADAPARRAAALQFAQRARSVEPQLERLTREDRRLISPRVLQLARLAEPATAPR